MRIFIYTSMLHELHSTLSQLWLCADADAAHKHRGADVSNRVWHENPLNIEQIRYIQFNCFTFDPVLCVQDVWYNFQLILGRHHRRCRRCCCCIEKNPIRKSLKCEHFNDAVIICAHSKELYRDLRFRSHGATSWKPFHRSHKIINWMNALAPHLHVNWCLKCAIGQSGHWIDKFPFANGCDNRRSNFRMWCTSKRIQNLRFNVWKRQKNN